MKTNLPPRRASALVAAIAIIGATPAIAQQRVRTSSDSVPRALVEALISPETQMIAAFGMGGAGTPTLVVGELPAGFVKRLWIPPDATVLGGLQTTTGGIAVLRSRLSRDSLLSGYRAQQAALGWQPAPKQQSQQAVWGFAPAPSAPADANTPPVFCSGGTLLMVNVVPAGGVQEVRADAFAGGDACNPRPRPAMGFRGGPPHPTLVNPPVLPGTASDRGFSMACTNWSSSGGGGQTAVNTSMTLDQLLSFYGKQLTDSGWKATDALITGRSWSHRDSSGVYVELTLQAQTRGFTPGCIDVEMRVTSRDR